jgi:AcrR family transcriptional regulator/predicted XRE-type DNA-binding protein
MQSQDEGAAHAEYRSQLLARVRTAIRSSGFAQRDVARHIGLDETKLSKALTGTRRFRPDELTQLASAAGVTVNWLLSGTDDAVGMSAVPAATILPTRHHEDSGHAQKRRNIVEHAWWLFAERGYSSVTIAGIATSSGMSYSTVHYYFRTKREIFAEALRYSVKLAFDRQIAELHLFPAPVDRLKRLVYLQLPAGERGRAEMSIWLQAWAEASVDSAWQEGHAQSYRRWSQTVHDIIVDGQNGGSFISVDADDLTMLLTALFDGLIIKVLTGMLTADRMYSQIEGYIDRTIVTPSS